MMATIVLGVFIAGGFGYGVWKVYKSFVSGKADCCGSGNCCGCSKCNHES